MLGLHSIFSILVLYVHICSFVEWIASGTIIPIILLGINDIHKDVIVSSPCILIPSYTFIINAGEVIVYIALCT